VEDLGEIVGEFLMESHENLDQIDRDLVALEQDPNSRDLISRIFRAIHTIKGTSGFLAFSRLEKLAHAGESLLSKLRDGSDSPAWASFSRRLNARKPLVPLIVWIARKMREIRSRESGSCSRETRSRSIWSRFSWLSIRNSPTISPRSSTLTYLQLGFQSSHRRVSPSSENTCDQDDGNQDSPPGRR